MKYFKYYLLAIAMIILDQVVKLAVHFNMEMGVAGQIYLLGDVFKLHYLTNPGMAFGMQLGSENGKLILTVVRLIAMVVIAVYLYRLAKKEVHSGLLWCGALILGGAIGNLIDSVFYGVFLNNAPYDAPNPWFHGQVVDMFYIDIWEGRIPEWVPLFGGDYTALWPVFNVADASIFVGVAIIIIFQKSFFKEADHEEGDATGDSQTSMVGQVPSDDDEARNAQSVG
ncbi:MULTISPECIES: lipoprotein signal peptidase [unclassified Imperialibacter]|uniref:lipoprotein signal peptidase n=1 Tax=unclassified Imperialibacter TaxID=2629706 RepID=UPI001258A711|nr:MULTISPECIES: lipoprotein signal peptidase [unclassified Imperialibacter]CAD5271628.1 Lipoprotein signal peptidase [Imperialibacter sp. 89]CAD5298948.1 Lipoprotein signal peptidase [Imperialibacter sp. 75]VVT35108.1 Lipoprotein signal peptidase [Imperialibacter sp. EC-SDR9]